MLDFIIEHYYVILIICVLLIFGIIGYIIDTLKNSRYKNEINELDTYIPEEEVFIQDVKEEPEEKPEEETSETVDNLIEEYNNEQKEEDSKEN